jgi:hypothetical protein
MSNHRSGRVLTVVVGKAVERPRPEQFLHRRKLISEPGRPLRAVVKNHHPLIGHGPHLTRTPRPARPPMFPRRPRTTRSTSHSGRYSGRALTALVPPGWSFALPARKGTDPLAASRFTEFCIIAAALHLRHT